MISEVLFVFKFQGCRKNVVQYDTKFNPIIEPTGRQALGKEESMRLYMAPSNCCMASFVNTAAQEECNAIFRCLVPKGWNSKRGFESLDEFIGVVKKPVLTVELTR